MADNFKTIFTGALQQVGNQLVNAMRANLNRVVGRSSGNLSKSIQSVVRETPKGPEVVITMLPYGPILDSGRGKSTKGGPEQTWRNKIEGWMSYKGITPKQGMTTEQVAFLITRKINRKGYSPKPFIQPAFNQVINKDLPGIFNEALDQAAKNTLVNDVKITLK